MLRRKNSSKFFVSVFSLTCAASAGALAALDWLSPEGWWLTWIAFAAYWVLGNRLKPWLAFAAGLFFGCTKMSIAFWWAEDMLAYTLNTTGSIPKAVFWGLVVCEAIPFAIGLWFTSTLQARTTSPWRHLLPVLLWVCFGSFWPRVFTWEIGHTLLGNLPFAQLAEFGGAPLLTFLVLSVASVPQLLIERWNARGDTEKRDAMVLLAAIILLAITSFLFGLWSIQSWNARLSVPADYSLGCVQDVPGETGSLARMREATENFGRELDLVIWPESCLGTHAADLPTFADPLEVNDRSLMPMVDTSKTVGLSSPLLAGGKTFLGEKRDDAPVHQTAFLIAKDGEIVSRYHKRGLMPLGEYVPGEDSFPWLHDWFQLGDQFVFGDDDAPMALMRANGEETKLGVLICYEDIAPAIVRRTCRLGAELLVCIINASAFERTIALEQHMRLAQLRTIENRRYLVRVSGTGVTCAIKPTGQVVQRLRTNERDSVVMDVHLVRDKTLFMFVGNGFAWFSGAIVFSVGVWMLANRPSREERTETEPERKRNE
jgi:apolipoprotein N-acyltransferase